MSESVVTTCLIQESSFLVLNKKSAWDEGLSLNLSLSDEGIKIQAIHEYVREREEALEKLTGGFAVTDFAVGQCNLIYILDATSRSIWLYDPNQQRIEQIECINRMFSRPASIVYAPGTLYVADVEAEQRIFALAEINWQIRWTTGASPEAADKSLKVEDFRPVDLTVDRDGNVYALTPSSPVIDDSDELIVPGGGQLAVVKIDVAGRLLEVFQPANLKLTTATALSQLDQSVAIVASRDGFIYVLEAAGKRVLQYQTDGTPVREFPVNEKREDKQKVEFEIDPSGFGVDTNGNLYVGDRRTIAPGEEDDRFIRRFNSEGEYLGEVANFRGSVEKLVVASDDRIYIFSREEKKIVILKPELKFLKLKKTALVKGRYFSKALDGSEPGTEWHKFILDADAPANTQIWVSYLAADEKQFNLNGMRDLDAFLEETMRKAKTGKDEQEIEQRIVKLDQLAWSKPIVNAPDALIHRAVGRYLWLRIELIGNESLSPEVKSVRVDFPRTSYLRYLPAVYQEDETSRDFLARFLSLFETFFAGLERQIDKIARYFDAESSVATGEFLRWLATWLAIAADKGWDEARLRALVKRAPELYKKRGTREGLEEIIEVFTGERPLIVEHFQTRCGDPGDALHVENREIQEIYNRLYGIDPYCFCVLLKPFQVKNEEEKKAVRRIINAEKAAHTCAGLLVLQPWIQLDMHTYMGINTYLSQPSVRLDLGSAIPRDTTLNDLDEAGQLERHSRVDMDITLT